jgi:RNA-splicing ligase RtcB
MDLAQAYASQNRMEMAEIIIKHWLKKDIGDFENFSSIHNYIDFEKSEDYSFFGGTMRKGAIKANKGQKVIIPLNMRDGSIIGIGKGNEFWNNSAPHGAGRIMSRSKAKQSFTMEEYQESMNGIYSTSVSEATLDESPMSYKPMDEIVEAIGGTVEITKIIKPVYNFKAS